MSAHRLPSAGHSQRAWPGWTTPPPLWGPGDPRLRHLPRLNAAWAVERLAARRPGASPALLLTVPETVPLPPTRTPAPSVPWRWRRLPQSCGGIQWKRDVKQWVWYLAWSWHSSRILFPPSLCLSPHPSPDSPSLGEVASSPSCRSSGRGLGVQQRAWQVSNRPVFWGLRMLAGTRGKLRL